VQADEAVIEAYLGSDEHEDLPPPPTEAAESEDPEA
jgi:hypothetical protein